MLHAHHKKDKPSLHVSVKEEKHPKETADFHKRFDVPRSEEVITYFSCAHKGKFLKQGKMFITQNYIGFHAQLFGKHHKKLVAFADISDIAKEHYGMIPNAVKITTIKKKEMLFASFVHRDSAYEALIKQWSMVKEKASVHAGSDSDDDHYNHVGDKKVVEMKQLSPKDDKGGNQYKNYDVTKKKLPPASTAHEHDGAEGSKSVSDRAAALVESGAIVSEEKQAAQSRPTSQQVMVPVDNQSATTTTIEVEPTKKRYLCCWL